MFFKRFNYFILETIWSLGALKGLLLVFVFVFLTTQQEKPSVRPIYTVKRADPPNIGIANFLVRQTDVHMTDVWWISTHGQ